MPKTKISEYSTTNSANTDIESINIDEGCAPSGINNAIRELMVHLKEFQTGSSGDPLTVAGGMFISGGGSANTLTVTGILTASGGTILSSTNTMSGSNIISGNINSSGTNTFSGSNVMSFGAGTSASPSIYFASDTNTGIFSPAADTIAFAEGGAEAMRIDSSGNVGIGTSSPGTVIDAQDATSATRITLTNTANAAAGAGVNFLVKNGGTTVGNATIRVDNSDNLAFFNLGGERARITSDGDLLVGTTNSSGTVGAGFKVLGGRPVLVNATSTDGAGTVYEAFSTGANAYRFYVGMGGTIFATNTTISAISDQRHKENIRDLDVGLNAVMQLKPRKFDWKEGKGKNVKDDRGFIAQEFEKVFPDLIDEWKDHAPEGEEPYKSVRQDLIPVLVKAIQELKAELDTVKAELATLKGN